jgi:hypothetical protein
MYTASLVNPECREVIIFFPEMITRQGGSDKNVYEQNAALIVDMQRLNLRFIHGVKPSDHKFLFCGLTRQSPQRR